MMPREAVRPLYRRARAELDGSSPDDPLLALVDYCERLVPFPPFDVWVADLRRNPGAHLRDVDESAVAPDAEAPATLASRRLSGPATGWKVSLKGFRDAEAWRGFLAFQEADDDRMHTTALVFRADSPDALCERFRAFEDAALHAFLRSALP